MYTYRLALNESYFRTLIERYYQQCSLLLKPESQFAVVGVVLIIVWSLLTVDGDRVGILVFGALAYAPIAVGGVVLIRVMVYRKFSNAPYFGLDSSTTLTEDGVKILTSRGEKLTAWSKYKKAVRYPDGIMLMRRGVIWWLPDFALASGAPQEVVSFLGTRMPVRSVA